MARASIVIFFNILCILFFCFMLNFVACTFLCSWATLLFVGAFLAVRLQFRYLFVLCICGIYQCNSLGVKVHCNLPGGNRLVSVLFGMVSESFSSLFPPLYVCLLKICNGCSTIDLYRLNFALLTLTKGTLLR